MSRSGGTADPVRLQMEARIFEIPVRSREKWPHNPIGATNNTANIAKHQGTDADLV